MSELLDLIERCKAATGPDREIDSAIAVLVGLAPTGDGWELQTHSPNTFNMAAGSWVRGNRIRTPKPYTSSLDAIVALIEAELPEWSLGLHDRQVGPENRLFRAYVVKGSPIRPTPFVEDGATRPLALCTAFLSGYSAFLLALSHKHPETT